MDCFMSRSGDARDRATMEGRFSSLTIARTAPRTDCTRDERPRMCSMTSSASIARQGGSRPWAVSNLSNFSTMLDLLKMVSVEPATG